MGKRVDYYAFVAGCLSEERESHDSRLAEQIALAAWDWQALIQTAAGEKVLPALPGALRARGLDRVMPHEIADFFAGLSELSRERNLDILSEAAAVASRLNAIGIEPVLLKGCAYLLHGVYVEVGGRYLADIDLLVAPADLGRAAAALRAAGYESDAPSPLAWAMHHYPALQRPGGARIELHRRLGMGPCASILPSDEMIRASRPLEWRGARVRLPCPEHLTTHHIMHSQVHHEYPERIWPSLRALHDLLLIERRFGSEINWQPVEALFRRAHQRGALRLHLALAGEVLGLRTSLGLRMSLPLKLRWWRRQMLRKFPALRRIDPLYLGASTLLWRARLLRELIKSPGGWNYLLHTPLRTTFYRHLQQEIATLPHEYLLGE